MTSSDTRTDRAAAARESNAAFDRCDSDETGSVHERNHLDLLSLLTQLGAPTPASR